jgi:hypothetical protein
MEKKYEITNPCYSKKPSTTCPSIPSALVYHHRDFVTPVTVVSIANFFKASLAVFCFCESNSMPELRSHKRGRSLDDRLFSKSEHRFITATGEVEAQATTSDSEYDSDVIVVGKGRTCPRVSRTPPNHTPSWMRALPQSPISPQSISSTSLPEPALLEWHPGTSSQDPPCLHLGETTDLKARVGYLELEAQNNIELRSEMQQNWCRVSAEYIK